MEQLIPRPTRAEEQRALLDKWEQRLYPIFLELALDLREFWRRWDSARDEDARESVRDVRLVSEMVVRTMHKGGFDARPDSLEALVD